MILGGIIGLIGSFIPEAIKLFKDWQDKKHEKEMLELQLKYARELSQLKIQEAQALAEIEADLKAYEYKGTIEFKPTGNKFFDFLQVFGNFLNQSVRPILTYVIAGGWISLKVAMFYQAGGTLDVLPQIWTETDSNFVAMVISFWFGNRAMMRAMGRLSPR